jgi:hypothetical protein
LLEVNASFIIFVELWNEELFEHVQLHDASNGHLHEEQGAVHSFFAESTKHVHLWAVMNMFQRDKWICGY